MPTVIIDGVEYAPVGSSSGPTGRIGVGITTRNRPEVLARALVEWEKFLPQGAAFVVVDDASERPVEQATFRFEKNAGIARSKNKCLELLANEDVEHFFLFDDDAWPLVEGWWEPYVASAEPHLMWVYDKPDGVTKRQVEVLYETPEFVAYHATRGCMLYVERRALERVGGMDPAFGTWGWEHQSWSDRIHAAGLTTARYMDVPDSADLIHSLDKTGEVKSTASSSALRFSQGPGLELRMESRHSDRYIEYRQQDDVVLTCLLTAQPDPQRGKPMAADAKMLSALHKSLKHDGRFVVLTTGLEGDLPGAEVEEVSQGINPYFERWVQYYRWLRAHPEVGRVWCVDGTDVKMTRDPFGEMEPGVLYFGYEPTTLRDPWMVDKHPDATLQKFLKGNPNLPIVNMGVVGGDREAVMAFAHAQAKFWFDDHIDWIYGWETGRAGVGDMASGNYIAYTEFRDVLSSGPHVTNVFKSERPSPTAWWQHK